jgi:hypothetical protein
MVNAIAVIGLVVVIIVFFAGCGVRFGYPLYQAWKRRQMSAKSRPGVFELFARKPSLEEEEPPVEAPNARPTSFRAKKPPDIASGKVHPTPQAAVQTPGRITPAAAPGVHANPAAFFAVKQPRPVEHLDLEAPEELKSAFREEPRRGTDDRLRDFALPRIEMPPGEREHHRAPAVGTVRHHSRHRRTVSRRIRRFEGVASQWAQRARGGAGGARVAVRVAAQRLGLRSRRR